MQNNPVGWFEIYVQDIDRAKRFYEGMLKQQLEPLDMPASSDGEDCDADMVMLAFPMTEQGYGASGALIQMEGAPMGPGGTMVYFSCEDCSVEAERAAKLGGSVFRQKMSIGEYGFIAIVVDSEGNMLGLHSRQ